MESVSPEKTGKSTPHGETLSQSDIHHGNRGGGPLHATATVDVDGFMSAADKVALDNVATLTALADPDADRVVFWDDSAGGYAFLSMGTSLTLSGTTLNVADGDKGDITVSSSGTAWTIDNGAVTTAKLGGDITTAGKNLLDDADAAAQRATLAAAGTGVTNTFPADQYFNGTTFHYALSAQSDGSYFAGGAYYGGSPANWRNTVSSQGGWALRNTGGALAIHAAASPGVAGTAFSSFPERVRIANDGRVGILTNNPQSALDVYGMISNRGGPASDDGYVNVVNGDGTFTGYVEFRHANTTRYGYLGYASASGTFNLLAENGVALLLGSQSGEDARIDTNGYLLVGYTSSNGAYRLQVNSQIFATSATIATSDGRYKENVTPLDGALDLVCQLNPVQFDWKEHPVHNFDRTQPTVGFIAQEVQQVLAGKPYLNAIVKSNTCTLVPEERDEEGNVTTPAVTEEFLGIAEGNMIALLTKAIQELKAEFDAYKASHP